MPGMNANVTKLILCVLLFGAAFGRALSAKTVNFDAVQPGKLPTGWQAGVTGGGNPQWSVEADATAPSKPNVLKQSGEGKFPWCVDPTASLKDGFVQVKFKPVSGKEDQAGGVIWRWQDGDNYYVARGNALEDNVTIYYTTKGERHERGRAKMKVATNEWHTLRVDFQGPHFTLSLDGTKALEWNDDTFQNAGAVGVWTKADSVTLFDDFTFEGK